MNQEVSASNSHAVLISELTTYRNELRKVIAAGKQVVKALPEKERMILLDAMIEAERKLT